MDSARRQRILRQHVQTDRLLGVEAVPVGAPAAPAPASPVPAAPPPRPAASAPSRSAPVPRPSPAPQPSPAPLVGATPATNYDRDTKLQLLTAMDEQEVRGCTRCPLCRSRTQTVFGEGNPDAEVMFIGEGPGQTEDEQGRPFVGKAGELLTKMIVAMGYQREDVYIANVVKCRPPNNRTPAPDEVQACWPYLRRQIEIIQPKVIVTLGGPATKTLLDTREGITRIRGTWHQYPGIDPPIPVMPTFHPAYLLRSYTRDNRAKVWSDLQAVMATVKNQDA